MVVGGIVVALVAAGGGYGLWRLLGAGPADLMQPGPLGEVALGSENAPVTVIEYASMTCPHCGDFAVNTFPLVKERYVDTGKVRFILREFPFDPIALSAFMLARCAGNDKFFPIVDLLFRTQRTWAVERPLEPLLAILKQAGFTEDKFKACLADQKILDGVQWVRDRAAKEFNVSATPTFFFNGRTHVGEVTIDQFDQLVKSAPPAPPPGQVMQVTR